MSNPTASQILAAMKDHGADVKTYSKWDSYGGWGNGCRGVLVHHTATASASVSNPQPSLGWLVSAYDKPAANMLVGKVPGTTWLCAAGPSYHCGQGGPWPHAGIPAGNRPDMLFGLELEDPGTYGKYTLTDYQVENTAKICAALWDLFEWPDPYRIGTHKCWTDLCHLPDGTVSGPGVNLGRKNDTHDGEWRAWPGDKKATPYNAPFWREKSAAYRDGARKDTWDGTVPKREALVKSHAENLSSTASWRLACRLYDLGYTDVKPLPKGKQEYPTAAVKAARIAWGWKQGDGGVSDKAMVRLFGKDK